MNTEIKFLQQIKYGIIAIEEINGSSTPVHFVGYKHKPTKKDFKFLEGELNNHRDFPQFNGTINRTVFLYIAAPDVVAHYKSEALNNAKNYNVKIKK